MTDAPIAAPALLVLDPVDDVAVAVRDLEPGRHRVSDGTDLAVTERVLLGHKVARRTLAAGARVRRCGVPIGSTTDAVEAGAWVHTHNLASDYLPTFARRGGAR